MKKLTKLLSSTFISLSLVFFLSACSSKSKKVEIDNNEKKVVKTDVESIENVDDSIKEKVEKLNIKSIDKIADVVSQGKIKSNILSNTNWQGTKVYDKDKNDLTKENLSFIGLAKYDLSRSLYEFFDKNTKKTRGDIGIFFITNDGKRRVLISETLNYQALVDIVELDSNIFIYKRMGKDKDGNSVEVFVEHIAYSESILEFTRPKKVLKNYTGMVISDVDGDEVLSNTLWRGTVALDKNGNDVSIFNSNFLGLAKYDYKTNKYEFYNATTGESRGDFGYFNVSNNNKLRSHISLGFKYGAILELTELNENKFTYRRMGKNEKGEKIVITVEHEPYSGKFALKFSN